MSNDVNFQVNMGVDLIMVYYGFLQCVGNNLQYKFIVIYFVYSKVDVINCYVVFMCNIFCQFFWGFYLEFDIIIVGNNFRYGIYVIYVVRYNVFVKMVVSLYGFFQVDLYIWFILCKVGKLNCFGRYICVVVIWVIVNNG